MIDVRKIKNTFYLLHIYLYIYQLKKTLIDFGKIQNSVFDSLIT